MRAKDSHAVIDQPSPHMEIPMGHVIYTLLNCNLIDLHVMAIENNNYYNLLSGTAPSKDSPGKRGKGSWGGKERGRG